jgi:hypothetical protein
MKEQKDFNRSKWLEEKVEEKIEEEGWTYDE